METVLTDLAAGVYVEQFEQQGRFERADGGEGEWSLRKHRLRGGLADGVDVVQLSNGSLSLEVLPTRGMGLWRGECAGDALGWQSPVQLPVHPSFVDLQRRGGLGWLDGFNEWLCRCGLGYHGPPGVDEVFDEAGDVVSSKPVTLHGRIANLPPHRVVVEMDDERQVLAVTGVIEEASLFEARLELTSRLELSLDRDEIRIVDEVRNVGGSAAEFELLYHINNGPPLLEDGSRIHLAFRELCPRNDHAAEGVETWNLCGPPTTGFAEQVYFAEPVPAANGLADVLLTTAAADRGLRVQFDSKSLPYFTLWKNTQSLGEGYVVGLEPATGFPNPTTLERKQKRLKTLQPDEVCRCELVMSPLSTTAAVADVIQGIEKLQQSVPPTVHSQPLKKWT